MADVQATEDVLTALSRLQDEVANTWVQPLADRLATALAADTTVADLRQDVELVRAELEQKLRDGLDAFRLTREYVGEDLLPETEGWSWFDWCESVRDLLGDRVEGPTR